MCTIGKYVYCCRDHTCQHRHVYKGQYIEWPRPEGGVCVRECHGQYQDMPSYRSLLVSTQVRYNLSGASYEEAQRVLTQFVEGILASVPDDIKPRLVEALPLPQLNKPIAGVPAGRPPGLLSYVHLFLT